LAWAGIAIVLGFYNITLTHVPWLCVDIPADRQTAAVAIVAAPLAYTFVGFVLYVLSDMKRWRLKTSADFLGNEGRTLFRLNNNCASILGQLVDVVRPPRVTIERSEEVVREALREAEAAMATLRSIRAAATHLRWLQLAIAYGWELIVPGIIGAFALWLSVPPFLRTVARLPWAALMRP
jgi:hypothetical protein